MSAPKKKAATRTSKSVDALESRLGRLTDRLASSAGGRQPRGPRIHNVCHRPETVCNANRDTCTPCDRGVSCAYVTGASF